MSENQSPGAPGGSRLTRGAIWVAIGTLIATSIVCVVWLLLGDQYDAVGRSFLTVFALAAFAGIAVFEANQADRREDWFAVASMATWIVALLVALLKIWLPYESSYFGYGMTRLTQLAFVVGVLQLALLHVRLYTEAWRRNVTVFTKAIYYVTLVLVVGLAGLLVFYLTFTESFDYDDFFWKVVLAVSILAFVGTALIPLLNALFAPKKPASQAARPRGTTPWPSYADGVTPLPALPDGSPDWNAYYTGFPTAPGAAANAPASAPNAFPTAAPAGVPFPGAAPVFSPPAPSAASGAVPQPAPGSAQEADGHGAPPGIFPPAPPAPPQ